ncbi:NADH-ubiquinone oxidoreductase-F iron-sulfur binding region domain-containing protein [Streptomyces sp. KR80]|uniref:NADH-ubiquinone oxidoreductase-F iron-sulfur binding region domain-containing protein n=1 Tax=Streptomyces sp. KR80 TaxID=3457426 RepID=UPI003FD3FB53
MDLRFGDSKPTDEEKAAVDALLGPPASAWEGADRTDTDLRWARGGRQARDRRDLLLPGLHAINDRVGWISEGALDYLCRRLTVPPAEAYGVATFYSMFAVTLRPATVVHVCTDLACTSRGSAALCAGLETRLGPPGRPRDGAVWQPSPCLGLCERAPAALAIRAGRPTTGAAARTPRPIAKPSSAPPNSAAGRLAVAADSTPRRAVEQPPHPTAGFAPPDSADGPPAAAAEEFPPAAGGKPPAPAGGSGAAAPVSGKSGVGEVIRRDDAQPDDSGPAAIGPPQPTASFAPPDSANGPPAAAAEEFPPAAGGKPPAPAGGSGAAAPVSGKSGVGEVIRRAHFATAVIAPATVEAVAAAASAPQDAPAEPPAAAAVPQATGAAARAAEPAPRAEVPQAGDPGLVLLRRVGVVDPASLDDYRAHGGYTALRRAFALGPAAVIREMTDAGLVGRGGAAFPTGRKWEATARQPDYPHYLVCNADESEPGTFKDRVLMEGDPYALIEAMTIAGYATGARRGYLYLRGEYPRALRRLEHAIAQARARGLLGQSVLGQGYVFDIEIRRGAGAYICGEETAIFNSIEGRRGEPRSKPPFPVEKGLFGKPTAVNNVETLVNVLPILERGAEAYASIGTGNSTGTKLFCVSGNIVRAGVYELPFGATLRELYEMAGGVPEGRGLRAVLLGGAAGGFVRPDELGIPLTFEGTRAAGTTLGSGVVLFLDDTVELPRLLLRIAEFFRDESCGQCVPCRVGTVRQEEALHRIADRTGAAAAADIELLREVGRAMRDASICGLGQTAWNAVESAIERLGAYR